MQTQPGDLKLIHHRGQPVGFARVEEILADVKPGWWQIRLLILQIPPHEVTWILRDEYIDGGEFTMGGEKMRLETVAQPRPGMSVVEVAPLPRLGDEDLTPPPETTEEAGAEPGPEPGGNDDGDDGDGGGKGKVVSLTSRRRNR